MIGKLGMLTLVAVIGVSALADDYQFIISDHSENHCQSRAATAIALNTASVGCATVAVDLDARFRSLMAADPVFLNTFPLTGCLIILK